MRSIRRVLTLLALGAWALPASAQAPKPNDAQQAKLAGKLALNAQSAAANRDLGVWYYKANRFAEARVPLEMARKLNPNDGVSALYAGLAAEGVKDYAAAKAAYNSYLAVGKTARVRKDIAARLVTVTQLEAQAAAKSAVANEARIAQVAGSPTTVAVLPFTTGGNNPDLQPLQVGLADLMITDLAKVKRVTVVERENIKALADEISLGKSGTVDQTSAVRAGKLIQAGSIVKGTLVSTGGQNLTMTSDVVSTQTSANVGKGVSESQTMNDLFSMEKKVVNGTFDALGIKPTLREQQDVDRRPTQSLAALTAYGRGLMAQDAGRLDEAARFFDNARSLDPGFAIAAQHAQSASAASQTTTTKIESGLKGSTEGATVSTAATGSSPAASSGLVSTLSTVVGDVNPTTTNTVAATNTTSAAAPPATRPAAAEATGTTQPAPRTGEVTIIIKKP